MNQNTIKLFGGNIIEIKELERRSSLKSIILQKTFLDLCEYVARKYYNYDVDSERYKTLVNSLFLKSNKLRVLASIIEFNKFNEIEELNFDIDLHEFRHFFSSKDIVFTSENLEKKNWLNKNELYYSILKWVVNKLYTTIYLLSGSQAEKNKSNTVIRSWVDDAEKIYKAEFETSIILIYPFFLNPARGFRYIIHCFKKYKYPVLVGIPYKLKNLIRIIISKGIEFDQALIAFENDAMVRHATLFRNFSIIYTSDEYMVNSHVLHSILIQQKKKVINKAHGIGYYSPFVNYNEMHMYNLNQINHYRNKNQEISYYILQEYLVNKIKYNPIKQAAIVFIDHGNLENFNLFYEGELQHITLMKLIEISKKLNYPLYIKFSLHASSADINEFLKKYNDVAICTNVKELAELKNILFINLFSTAYFDFSKFGNVLFVESNVFKPSLMFGDDIDCCTLESIENTISNNFLIN